MKICIIDKVLWIKKKPVSFIKQLKSTNVSLLWFQAPFPMMTKEEKTNDNKIFIYSSFSIFTHIYNAHHDS